MWEKCEVDFWQEIISEKNYNANYLESIFSFITSDLPDYLIGSINEIPLRDNTNIYSKIVGDDKAGDNLIAPNIDLSKLQVGNKILALYEEDNDYYVAEIRSFDILKKIVNVVYDGFEDEGEYEVSIFDIEDYNEEEVLFSDDIFDKKIRDLITMEKSTFPLDNDTKVFAKYHVDGMYYLGTVISSDIKTSTYEVIFSGFQDEGVFVVKGSEVLRCPDHCYNITTDVTYLIPFEFPEICNDKEELIDSYLLSKYHSDALYSMLQEVITNQNTNDLKVDIPEFMRKYFDNNDSVTFDKMLSIYVFTVFLGMCFLKSYQDIQTNTSKLH
uniref:Tudor domain-containing protein n=1 Tax=Strongyloides venezuelensis TaxID=75913 RepID=A0A0K0F716_STRVS